MGLLVQLYEIPGADILCLTLLWILAVFLMLWKWHPAPREIVSDASWFFKVCPICMCMLCHMSGDAFGQQTANCAWQELSTYADCTPRMLTLLLFHIQECLPSMVPGTRKKVCASLHHFSGSSVESRNPRERPHRLSRGTHTAVSCPSMHDIIVSTTPVIKIPCVMW